jgi:hypothetical protein
MNPSAKPQTSRNRDRALARVGSITSKTAIIASVATVGFGGLAAFTYSGDPSVTSIDQTTNSTDATTNDTTTNSSGTTSGRTSGGTTNGLQATQAPTTSTRHKSHTTSGGSG